MYVLTVWEPALARSRCWQAWSLLRPVSLACRWPPLCCLFTWSFLCMCSPRVLSSHKETNQFGSGHHLNIIILTQSPLEAWSPDMIRFQVLRFGKDTIQLVTVNMAGDCSETRLVEGLNRWGLWGINSNSLSQVTKMWVRSWKFTVFPRVNFVYDNSVLEKAACKLWLGAKSGPLNFFFYFNWSIIAYNAALVSAVKQCESAACIHIPPPP